MLNFRAIFVNIMSFGLAPAALTQSAHNTPISKYYTKYSLYDAPRTRGRWIASSSLTYYTLQTILIKKTLFTHFGGSEELGGEGRRQRGGQQSGRHLQPTQADGHTSGWAGGDGTKAAAPARGTRRRHEARTIL